jgi:hypothetical protein
VHRTFEPLIADWQREWQDAPPDRRARISMRGLAAFVCAAIVSSPRVMLTPAPKSVWNRVVTKMARFTLLASAILTLPFLLQINANWWRGMMLFFALPGILAIAFPFAVIGAVDAIRGHDPLPKHVERAAAVKLGIAALVIMIFFGGWVVPASNQAWRVAMNPYRSSAPARGLRELSTYELIVDPARATAHERPTSEYARAISIQRELNNRASLALLPLLLLWRRWRALDLPPGRWYSPRSAAWATVVMASGFLFLRSSNRFVEEGWHLPAGTGLWLPLLILAAIGLIRMQWAARPLRAN